MVFIYLAERMQTLYFLLLEYTLFFAATVSLKSSMQINPLHPPAPFLPISIMDTLGNDLGTMEEQPLVRLRIVYGTYLPVKCFSLDV